MHSRVGQWQTRDSRWLLSCHQRGFRWTEVEEECNMTEKLEFNKFIWISCTVYSTVSKILSFLGTIFVILIMLFVTDYHLMVKKSEAEVKNPPLIIDLQTAWNEKEAKESLSILDYALLWKFNIFLFFFCTAFCFFLFWNYFNTQQKWRLIITTFRYRFLIYLLTEVLDYRLNLGIW